MPTTDASASSAILRILIRATGYSLEEIVRAAGIAPERLTGGAVSYPDGMRVWQTLAELSGDPILGHTIGTGLRLHHVGVFGPLVAHAENVRAGLLATCRAFAVALPEGCLTTDQRDGAVRVRYARPQSPVWVRHGVESLFATLVSLLREASGTDVGPAEVSLSFPAPAHRAVFDHFYGTRVHFGAERDELCFEGPLLGHPMIGNEPALLRVLEERATEVLSAGGIEERAVRACREALDEGEPATLESAARRLGVSARSLQRKLAKEDVSFRQVRDGACRSVAEELLREGRSSVDAIAERVGYSSRTAFERAFARWTGLSPARWRREHG